MKSSKWRTRGLTEAERFWFYVDVGEGCWTWKGAIGTGGYGSFAVNRRGAKAHRVSWSLAYGAIPDGLHVCHACDNRLCVNPNHLFLGTHACNIADKVAKGRQARGDAITRNMRRPPQPPARLGEAHPYAKLTVEKVKEIRLRLANGEGQRALARAFGMTQGSIWALASGRTWRHV